MIFKQKGGKNGAPLGHAPGKVGAKRGQKRGVGITKGAFTYDVSSREGGGFETLTVADKGGGGLSLADVSKNT